MGGWWSREGMNEEDKRKMEQRLEMLLSKLKHMASSQPVFVFSKTYCGYCSRVKQLLTQLGANYQLLELDSESDEAEMQSALAKWTGQRTVPNVFIGGKHIGGCDDVMQKHSAGKLLPLLKEAGALASSDD